MSEEIRPIARRFPGAETLEGAGVRLRRMFGNGQVPLFDPFLLLDNFGSSNPADYVAGFPWHPHRGIETVTYMLEGEVDHGDTLGNSGTIGPGDVQWMTAGSGIIHQEMPRRSEGLLTGFQLWVNLPHSAKMTTPAYRGLTGREIPAVPLEHGGRVRVVAGRFGGVEGPVRGISVAPTYLDLELPPGESIRLPTPRGHTAFAQAIRGAGSFSADPSQPPARPSETILFGPGDRVDVRAGDEGLRFLFVTGRPLGEPVAWYGPIVMNRRTELEEAFRELRQGTFLKTRAPIVEE
ncbi:MAG: pirin family protein [Thermoplasmata archaeon]